MTTYYKPRESVVYSSYDIFGLGWHKSRIMSFILIKIVIFTALICRQMIER